MMTRAERLEKHISELYHGGMGYTIVFYDRERETIHDGKDIYERVEGDKSNKYFLKRIKRQILEANPELDTVLVVMN